MLGRLDCASPSTVGLPAGWAGSVAQTPLVLRLPGRLCLPCAAPGDPRVLPWQQNHGLCFQKTSQSPVCGAGLGVWSTCQSPRRGKKRKGRVCRARAAPPPAPLHFPEFQGLHCSGCMSEVVGTGLIKKRCLEGDLIWKFSGAMCPAPFLS